MTMVKAPLNRFPVRRVFFVVIRNVYYERLSSGYGEMKRKWRINYRKREKTRMSKEPLSSLITSDRDVDGDGDVGR